VDFHDEVFPFEIAVLNKRWKDTSITWRIFFSQTSSDGTVSLISLCCETNDAVSDSVYSCKPPGGSNSLAGVGWARPRPKWKIFINQKRMNVMIASWFSSQGHCDDLIITSGKVIPIFYKYFDLQWF
jgi:hypothetical protein